MEIARSKGFKVYAETADFDLLLVATEQSREHYPGLGVGEQIGIQAKLQPNLEVLYQSLPRAHGHRLGSPLAEEGPNYYAILVPFASPEFVTVANRLGIYVYTAKWRRTGAGYTGFSYGALVDREDMGLGKAGTERGIGFAYQLMEHRKPCWVPDVEVTMEAGTKNPLRMTPWKLAAVKLCLIAMTKGHLTSRDFAEAKISMTRWYQAKWIIPGVFVVENGRRVKQYLLNEAARPPSVQYPEVVDALEREGKLDDS
jgi:hypothetical protein